VTETTEPLGIAVGLFRLTSGLAGVGEGEGVGVATGLALEIVNVTSVNAAVSESVEAADARTVHVPALVKVRTPVWALTLQPVPEVATTL
jgi:hypothetical protein